MIHYHWGNRVFHAPPEVIWRWLVISTVVLVLALVWYLLELILAEPRPHPTILAAALHRIVCFGLLH